MMSVAESCNSESFFFFGQQPWLGGQHFTFRRAHLQGAYRAAWMARVSSLSLSSHAHSLISHALEWPLLRAVAAQLAHERGECSTRIRAQGIAMQRPSGAAQRMVGDCGGQRLRSERALVVPPGAQEIRPEAENLGRGLA